MVLYNTSYYYRRDWTCVTYYVSTFKACSDIHSPICAIICLSFLFACFFKVLPSPSYHVLLASFLHIYVELFLPILFHFCFRNKLAQFEKPRYSAPSPLSFSLSFPPLCLSSHNLKSRQFVAVCGELKKLSKLRNKNSSSHPEQFRME